MDLPHGKDSRPACVSCNPRQARVKEVPFLIAASTDSQPPPRPKGEAVEISWLRQVRDGAGVRRREQFNL